MKKTYINGMGCVSAQDTSDNTFLETAEFAEDVQILPIKTPVYKDYISPAAIRRMAKGVKNGIVASTIAMKDAQLDSPDAIITGTGMGCIEDSESFLKGILDNNEQHLTPTAFIQSTHNTVGAQIALGLQCKAYNLTYVNGAVSFESALLDAKLGIEADEWNSVLIGGIDETADYTMSLFKLAGFIKKETDKPYKILNSTTSGVVYGEGATFFVLGNEPAENTYAEIIDCSIISKISLDQIEAKTVAFLAENNCEISEIDAVVLGYNGDMDDEKYYDVLALGLFVQTAQVYFKHLTGEFNTASAFGLWTGAKIVRTQSIPPIIRINEIQKSEYKKVLIYNHYRGIDHSFTLISR